MRLAERGPANVEELPVSQEMRRELAGLRDAYATFANDVQEPRDGDEMMEADGSVPPWPSTP